MCVCRSVCVCVCVLGGYLGRDPVKVLPQHPAHVLACVRGHLVLQQEGELAALADAVEVAVELVVLTACGEKSGELSEDNTGPGATRAINVVQNSFTQKIFSDKLINSQCVQLVFGDVCEAKQ